MSDVKTQSIEDYIASLAVPEEVVPVVDPFESATAEEVINTELVDTSSIPPTVESEDDAAVSSVARVAYTTPEASPQTITDYLQYPSNCIAGAGQGTVQETVQGIIDTVLTTVHQDSAAAHDAVTALLAAAEAQRLVAEADINQAIADELAARGAADAAETAARTALATATTTALAQAASDIQAAHDAADAAAQQAADALTTAQSDIAQASADAAAALATARGELETAIDAVQASSDGVAALVSAETTARQTADSAEVTARQTAIAGVQSDIGTVVAALSAEQTARANADSAETSARESAISAVQTAITNALAAITAEASTRATADTAETNARTAAISALQGALTDAMAAITTEASTRATADTAETNARQAAISTVQGQIADANAAITAEATTRAAADSAETTARQSAVSSLQTDLAAANAAIAAEASTRATADTTETTQRQAAVSALQGAINDAMAAITSEASTRATQDTAETNARNAAISSLQTALNDVSAALTAESSTRATQDTAETNARTAAISSLQGQINSANAALTAEQNTRATNDAAETTARQSAVSDLQGQINSATAAITAEANTRATNDAAETNQRTAAVSSLSAKGSPKRVWSQSTAPTFADIFPPGVNACPLGNLDNPTPYGQGMGTWENTGRAVTRGMDHAGYTLEGGHTFWALMAGAWAAQTTYECFNVYFDNSVGVVGGATYEWSMYVGAHRCRGFLIIAYYDASGAYITESLSNANDWQEAANGGLSTYRRLYVRATIPSNAASVALALRGDNQGANNKVGQSTPYIFGTRPQFARVTAEHPTPLDWQPYDAPAWIDTGDNNKRYLWSGIGGAGWLEQSDLRIAANAAAITSEASTRASADATETSQRQAAISAVQTDIASAVSAISSEASTRATNDATETSQRQAAVSGLQTDIANVNAAITSEQNTRASADSAETTARQQQVSQLSTPGGALVDPMFARSAFTSAGVPWGWVDWSWGTAICSVVAGKIGDKALKITANAAQGPDQGIYIASPGGAWNGPDLRTTRYFVVEVDFEYVSGDLTGAGVLFYGYDGSGGFNDGTTDRVTFLSVTGPSPQAGKIYTIRKLVDGYGARVPDKATANTLLHLFAGWTGFTSTPATKSFIIHRINPRPATQPEIDAGTAGGAIGAAITSEASTRASADAAETSARTSAVSSLQGQIDSANAAIAGEQSTRASAISAEATARLTLSTTLSAQANQKRTFRTATEPTFAELFPPNVQACAVANLKPSDGTTGIGAWTNTARTLAEFGLWYGGTWNLLGEASVAVRLQGAWTGAYECFDLNEFGQCRDVVPGQRYEFSVYTGAHRCRVYAFILWCDASDNDIMSSDSTGFNGLYGLGGVNDGEKNGGGSNSLSDWKRLGVIAQAPAGATVARLIVRADNQGASAVGQSDPYVFACRPYFGLARNDQTTFTDWQPFQPATWIKTSENNKPYAWSGIWGAHWVAAADTRIDSNTTNISQLFSSTNGIAAMWGVQIDTNGKVIGRVQLNGSNGTSSFDVLATSFTVSMPGYSSPIFEVGNVGGTPKITMRADVIQDNSVTDGKVSSVALNSAVSSTGTGGSVSVTVALKAGIPVLVMGKSASPGAVSIGSSQTITLKQGSTTIDDDTQYAAADGSGGAVLNSSSLLATYTPPSDGNYTFSVNSMSSTKKTVAVTRTYKG